MEGRFLSNHLYPFIILFLLTLRGSFPSFAQENDSLAPKTALTALLPTLMQREAISKGDLTLVGQPEDRDLQAANDVLMPFPSQERLPSFTLTPSLKKPLHIAEEIEKSLSPHGNQIDGNISSSQKEVSPGLFVYKREIIAVRFSDDENLRKFFYSLWGDTESVGNGNPSTYGLLLKEIQEVKFALASASDQNRKRLQERLNHLKGVLAGSVFFEVKKHVPYIDRDYGIGERMMIGKILGYDSAGNINGGVCRHQAILIAAVFEQLILNGFLDGKILYSKGNGHGWAVYLTSSGVPYVFDAAQASKPIPANNALFMGAEGVRFYLNYLSDEIRDEIRGNLIEISHKTSDLEAGTIVNNDPSSILEVVRILNQQVPDFDERVQGFKALGIQIQERHESGKVHYLISSDEKALANNLQGNSLKASSQQEAIAHAEHFARIKSMAEWNVYLKPYGLMIQSLKLGGQDWFSLRDLNQEIQDGILGVKPQGWSTSFEEILHKASLQRQGRIIANYANYGVSIQNFGGEEPGGEKWIVQNSDPSLAALKKYCSSFAEAEDQAAKIYRSKAIQWYEAKGIHIRVTTTPGMPLSCFLYWELPGGDLVTIHCDTFDTALQKARTLEKIQQYLAMKLIHLRKYGEGILVLHNYRLKTSNRRKGAPEDPEDPSFKVVLLLEEVLKEAEMHYEAWLTEFYREQYGIHIEIFPVEMTGPRYLVTRRQKDYKMNMAFPGTNRLETFGEAVQEANRLLREERISPEVFNASLQARLASLGQSA